MEQWESLAERVRTLLAGTDAREVSMFGSLAFMVDDRMHVAVRRDGDLLVHVAPARYDELLALPGARPAQMGAGRPMGPRWVEVDGGSVDDETSLATWLQVAREHDPAR
ncbi:TfoX/Sxy family protein [Isoptericola croceus]|uniref:TfoX/Sxy family protein n=1 Tax=Isoptericola croceus TaxID=3031406 RepID=UPI0023FA4903|nr:TfoX/Sxy family protein [Isoptericola croceus]